VATYWRDLLNFIEADLIENKGDDLEAMLHAKLVVLDSYRIDYEKQAERAERELGKIEFEAKKIRKELST
jgi:hypothetical protein